MVKLQQKISGGWRSQTGATALLDVRSCLSTSRKNNKTALDVLPDLFTGNTWIPTPAGTDPLPVITTTNHRPKPCRYLKSYRISHV